MLKYVLWNCNKMSCNIIVRPNLSFPTKLFIYVLSVLCERSRYPLLCGCEDDVFVFSIFNSLHIFLNKSDRKFVPQSVKMVVGIPYIHTQHSRNTCTTVSAIAVANVTAFAYRESFA